MNPQFDYINFGIMFLLSLSSILNLQKFPKVPYVKLFLLFHNVSEVRFQFTNINNNSKLELHFHVACNDKFIRET